MAYRIGIKTVIFLIGLGSLTVLFKPAVVLPEAFHDIGMALGLPVMLWAVALFYLLIELPGLADQWRQDDYYPKIILWLGIAMLIGAAFLIPVFGYPVLDRRSLMALPGVVLMFAAWMTMLSLVENRWKKSRGIVTNTAFLKQALLWSAYLVMPFVFIVIIPIAAENLLQKVLFFCLIVPFCGALAFAYSTFARNLWLQHIGDREEQHNHQLVIGIVSFALLLGGLTYFNKHPLDRVVRRVVVWVADKSGPGKKRSIEVILDGQKRSFAPNKEDWECIKPNDSLALIIRSGALGFDFIEHFEAVK